MTYHIDFKATVVLSWNVCPSHALYPRRRYMKSIRDDAPYVPSNVDFVAANNGLAGADDVRAVLMKASYMVLGLGGAVVHASH